MNKIPVILDCDPGIDDAFALLLAKTKTEIDLKAVTSVAGNVGVEHTTRNLRYLAKKFCLDCPVARGAAAPLVKQGKTAAQVHGEDGFGGLSARVKESELAPLSELFAVELMAKILRESEVPVTIIAVGPLTNIALLIKAYPDVLPKIKAFYIMGGGMRYGNRTATAEFNFYVDPEAAQIVFTSGVPIVLAALDITLQAYVTQEDVQNFAKLESPVVKELADLLKFYAVGDKAIHDPVAVLALTNPEAFETEALYMEVETNEGATRGMSFVDARENAPAPNVTFLKSLSRAWFLGELQQALEVSQLFDRKC